MIRRALFCLAAVSLPIASAGAQSVAPALPLTASGGLSGYYPNPVVATGTIMNAMLVNAPPLTFKGNPTGSIAVVQDIPLGSNFAPILPASSLSAASWGNNGLQLGGPGVTCTDTSATGSVSTEGCFAFPPATLAAANTRTVTNVYELYLPAPIAGSGIAGTPTLYSLIAAGAVRIGGGLNVTGGAINLDVADNDAVNICSAIACTQTVSIGNSANTTAIGGPMTLASTLTLSNNILFGPDSASPVGRTLQGNNAAAGNPDIVGGQLNLSGGVSTGAGLGGSVVIKTSRAGSPGGTSQNSATPAYTFDAKDHGASGGQKPVVSSCGSGSSIDTNATDTAGQVTVGTVSPTSCTITFKIAYGTYNHCVVSAEATLASFGYSYSLTAITVTGSALSGKVDYRCEGS